jgi:hypothetical protein
MDPAMVNDGLKKRWAASNVDSIPSLKDLWQGPGDFKFPVTSAGKEICLRAQLQGQCRSTGCTRGGTHRRLAADDVETIHKFLDKCGVARV